MSLNLINNVQVSDITIEMTYPELYDYDLRYPSIRGISDHLGGV
jgi:hypothetical protein